MGRQNSTPRTVVEQTPTRYPVNYIHNGSWSEVHHGQQPTSQLEFSSLAPQQQSIEEPQSTQWRINNLNLNNYQLHNTIKQLEATSKLITETVCCGEMTVKAVVDTGAVNTVTLQNC